MTSTLLRRIGHDDRFLTGGAVLVVIVLSWSYLLAGAGTNQEMGGMLMPMSIWPWTLSHAALMLSMWIVMMAAMMLPSAMPVILLHGTIAKRKGQGARIKSALFVSGYVAMWGAFSVAAVALQFALEWTGLLSPMMEATSTILSGLILIVAGIYQLLPLKAACLSHCRSPLEFLLTHWRPGNKGAFTMGAHHGIYCLGCCWGLMLLIFVGGLMNYLWLACLAVFVLLEKAAPGGTWLGRLAAVPLMLWGVFLLVP